MWLIVTVLPAPEGPSRTVISPAGTLEVDAAEDLGAAEALDHARELDRRPVADASADMRSSVRRSTITVQCASTSCSRPSGRCSRSSSSPRRRRAGLELLFETVAALKPLEPDYVSVTYGAGGATRDGTVEIAERIKRDHGLEVMAHLSCVGETREGLAVDPRPLRRDRDRQRARPARRPAPRRGRLHPARGRALLGGRADRVHHRWPRRSRSAAPASRRSTRRPTTSPPTSPT